MSSARHFACVFFDSFVKRIHNDVEDDVMSDAKDC